MTRFGMGYDVHRLVEGRRLILGGVAVPYEKGLLGHSDADVLLHAIADALLGAAALGDIGRHFPDTDPRYAGADSGVLLARVRATAEAHGLYPADGDEHRAHPRGAGGRGQRQGHDRGEARLHRQRRGNFRLCRRGD